MEFREILNEYLIEKGISQTKFAQMIEVKQSQVSEWLKGKAKPSYDIMKRILIATGLSANYWFDYD